MTIILLLLALLSPQLAAQTTKVRGTVIDAETREPVPFAGVYFEGTSIGISTDMYGCFNLETREKEHRMLVCQLLGYDIARHEVQPGVFNEVSFVLHPTNNRLSGAVVKADNKRVKRLLANIEAHRDANNPDMRPAYRCEAYNKVELDLAGVKGKIDNRRLNEQMGFIYEYMDTSSISGRQYIPAMISESVIERRHSLNPTADEETVLANRISGINPDNNLLSQFTGSMRLKMNFYKPFLNAFGAEFPSPIQSGGLLYYNYFIIDSLQVDGRKTYLVRYHPKRGISSPAFDGEMQIDAEDFALRSIYARMKHGSNVNWLRDLVLDTDFRRLPDSSWFYQRDNLYIDLSIDQSDSTKLFSIMGTREINWEIPVDDPGLVVTGENGPVEVLPEANSYSDDWWVERRPYPLSVKEEDIYKMVERIQQQKLYKTVYNVTYALINRYIDVGNFGYGPFMQFVSVNNLEGLRLRLGMHTTKDWSQKDRFTGFVAYGFGDKRFKGGASWEHMFLREKTRKLTLDAHYDINQLGRGTSKATAANILTSLWQGSQKPAPMSSYSAMYEHEFSSRVNAQADMTLKRYFPSVFVPMTGWDGVPVGSIASNEMHLGFRFSKDETVNRGYFEKIYVHTFHPVFSVDLTGSVPGLRQGDYGFFRPELSFNWRLKLPPLGTSDLRLNAGTIIGQVPWPMLNLYRGNVTNFMDRSAFSCMDYFEFASDSWATLMWYHDFGGFFLGKIPGLKLLKLRESFLFKAAWGDLRDCNNGTDARFGAPMRFPEGMSPMGNIPYMEIGAGLSNILKVFRVDGIWRLTHRETTLPDGSVVPASRLFTINVRVDASF